MNRTVNKSGVAAKNGKVDLPRPTLSTRRWTHRTTHPKLVSFSWAQVKPMSTQR